LLLLTKIGYCQILVIDDEAYLTLIREAVDQKKDRQRIVAGIRLLADDPRPPDCEKLAGGDDRYRIRVGRYRVIYSVGDRELLVVVVRVGHRKDVCTSSPLDTPKGLGRGYFF
jgi:mRNA interferase RelE/StbE